MTSETDISEEIYRLMVENSNDLMFLAYPDGSPKYVNPAYLNATGYTWEEIESTGAFARIHEEDLPNVLEYHKTVMGGKPVTGAVYRLIRKHGDVVTLEINAHPVRDRAGNVKYVMGVSRDITSRIEREEQLNKQVAQLALLNRISKDTTTVMSLEEVLEEAARAICLALGELRCLVFLLEEDAAMATIKVDYPSAEGTSFKEMTFNTDFPYVQTLTREAKPVYIKDATNEKTLDPDVRRVFSGMFKNRGIRTILAVPIIVKDSMTGAFVLYTTDEAREFSEDDITMAHTIASQLAGAVESARLLENEAKRADRLTVINRMSSALVSLDGVHESAREIIKHTYTLYGCDLASIALIDEKRQKVDVIGRDGIIEGIPLEEVPIGDIIRSGTPAFRSPKGVDHGRALYPDMQQTGKTGEPGVGPEIKSEFIVPLKSNRGIIGTLNLASAGDVRCQDKETQMLVLETTEYIALALDNRILRRGWQELIATLEQKVHERTVELEEAKSKAEEADKLKSQLLSTVSHELKTPLHAIKGYAETLLLSAFKMSIPTKVDYVRNVKKEADRLIELIEDLLDAARLESGMLNISPVPMNLCWAARERVDLWHRRGSDVVKQRIVLVESDGAVRVTADPTRVAQVIDNYIDNAVKYSPEMSTIMVEVKREGDMAVLTVTDEGPGIPPEHLSRLFERFYRVSYNNVPDSGGTGLGLSICYGLMKSMNGEVFVESEFGKGSVFGFKLPLIS